MKSALFALLLLIPFAAHCEKSLTLRAYIVEMRDRAANIEEKAKAAEVDRSAAITRLAEAETANTHLEQATDELQGQVDTLAKWGEAQGARANKAEAALVKVREELSKAKAHLLKIKLALAAAATALFGAIGFYFLWRIGPWGMIGAAGMGLAAGAAVMVFV